MRSLLIFRPQPGGDATARRAEAEGFTTLATPLFVITAEPWRAPDPAGFDGLLLTSANAVRTAGEQLARYHDLRIFAVGAATEKAAEQAGFTKITTGTNDGDALLHQAVAAGMRRLLHLTGRDHTTLGPVDCAIERHIVYRADALTHLPARALEALQNGSIALLHSPRAAHIFAELLDEAGIERDRVRIAAFSNAVARAAGTGWQQIAIAAQPTDQALLAAAARLCDQDGDAFLADRDEDRA